MQKKAEATEKGKPKKMYVGPRPSKAQHIRMESSFRTFTKINHSEENVLFIDAVKDLFGKLEAREKEEKEQQELAKAEEFQRRFKEIYNEFIAPDAKRQINLPDKDTNALAEEDKKGSFTLGSFKSAVQEIEMLLEHGPKLQFYQSDYCRKAEKEIDQEKKILTQLIEDLDKYLESHKKDATPHSCCLCCFSCCGLDKHAIYKNISELQGILKYLAKQKTIRTDSFVLSLSASISKHQDLVGSRTHELTPILVKANRELMDITPCPPSADTPDGRVSALKL
jgi:hypothetical protein